MMKMNGGSIRHSLHNFCNKNREISGNSSILRRIELRQLFEPKTTTLTINSLIWCFVHSVIEKVNSYFLKTNLIWTKWWTVCWRSSIFVWPFSKITILKMLYHPPHSIKESAAFYFLVLTYHKIYWEKAFWSVKLTKLINLSRWPKRFPRQGK